MKAISFLLALSMAAICPSVGYGQQRNYTTAIKASRDSVARFMKQKTVAGAAITVSVNGKIVWSEGFGFADLEQKIAVDPAKTKFRIASISKSMTATGLAVLYEQKKIQLDSSIVFYVPAFSKKKYRPTVRQLTGHLAGIRGYRGKEFFITQHYSTVMEGLDIILDDSLESKPGTKFLYSTHGFDLLSGVMEKASGEDFLSLMRKYVWGPLQLSNTVPDVVDSVISFRGRYYEVVNHLWVNSPFVDNSYKWAGGGFLSTSEDVAKFGNAYLQPGFLKQETITLFTSPQKLLNGGSTGYGIGWGSGKNKNGRYWFGHSGGAVGGSSNLIIYPTEKVVVAILTNVSGLGLERTAHTVGELFMKSN
jgi:serine beta-lactamase-like protein LACTB, mitochondrial